MSFANTLITVGNERVLTVPVTQPSDGREFRYVFSGDKDEFGIFLKKIIRYVSPLIPKNGGAMIEGLR